MFDLVIQFGRRHRGHEALQPILITGVAVVFLVGLRSMSSPTTNEVMKRSGELASSADSSYGKPATAPSDATTGSSPTPSVQDAIDNGVKKTWPKNAEDTAANLENDNELADKLAEEAGKAKNVSLTDLKQLLAIESQANRNTGTNSGGYAGLFQMGAEAAREVGADFEKINDPSEWAANVEAGVKYADLTAKRLEAKGVDGTALNIYLAYQQGVTGASNLIKAVKDGTAATLPATANQLNNMKSVSAEILKAKGPGGVVTQQDYYDYVKRIHDTVAEKVK